MKRSSLHVVPAAPDVMRVGEPAPPGSRCDCGLPAITLCGTGGDYPTVVHCKKPVCSPIGHWCRRHRHAPGSMTYAAINTTLRAEFHGFHATGGFWDKVVTFFLNRLPVHRQMQRLLKEKEKLIPPPAPLPNLVVLYRGRYFYESAGRMVEDESYSKPAPCAGAFGDVPGLCGRCNQRFEDHDLPKEVWPQWARDSK